MSALDTRTRWLALIVLCLGDLMIVLDTTIVNVALPSIREDLGFSETSLAWVVNAYLLTFGGFLLLGGRLGDLFGHRRMFLGGVTLFTLASITCGLASSAGNPGGRLHTRHCSGAPPCAKRDRRVPRQGSRTAKRSPRARRRRSLAPQFHSHVPVSSGAT